MTQDPALIASPLDRLAAELHAIRDSGLWRQCVTLDSPPRARISIEGREYLHLCSNNYLDLAGHHEVVEAARQAAAQWGTGSGSARLVTGTSRDAVALEAELAEFKRAPAALLFSSGYLANLGLVTALAGPEAWLVCDELNHASLIDAARLSRARVRTYAHSDVAAAAEALAQAPPEAKKLILTDGVFSMDGDLAPLAELNALALESGAWLIVDDAHGTGVVGPEGRGAVAAAGIAGDHIVQVVTLSKALGSQGAAIVGAREVIALAVNRARPFIFETAPGPPAVAAARAALNVVVADAERRACLAENTALVREGVRALGFEFPDAPTPIVPLVVGSNEKALALFEGLRARGYWVTAIRPPSVRPGAARLRLTVMATHAPEELRAFVAALGEVAREFSIP